jgi:hypothetical protein
MSDHTATYSAEDNKLRIYPGSRLDDELGEERYKEFKAAGYKWAAKQECFVCARWTPTAEDWALDLCGEIGDEDYSPEERSADRAERFTGYREKRRDEAHGHADSFDAGPAIHAHHRQERAERSARRQDRHHGHALSQWSKAEYWQQRTDGVIAHALYKSSAPVRRSRLLRLEADRRKQQKSIGMAKANWAAWVKVQGEANPATATRWAITLAGSGSGWMEYQHPRVSERRASLYTLLTDSVDPITGHEAAELYIRDRQPPAAPGGTVDRWAKHYELRIGYEKAMLDAEGGMAAESDIEPAGWIQPGRSAWQLRGCGTAWLQIQKVNKSNTTGRVVSVGILAPTSNDYDRNGKPYGEDNPRPMVLVLINVERLGENAYRPPTDEEREAFATQKKANKQAPVSLINPTDEDAERFQLLLNDRAAEHAKERQKMPSKPSTVERITQQQYSRYSGPDSIYYVMEFTRFGAPFKVRMRRHGFYDYNAAENVVILTDKPQKPLPLDWESLLPAEEPEAVTVGTNQKELFA